MSSAMNLSRYIELVDAKLNELKSTITTPPAAPPSVQFQQSPTKQIRRLQDAGYTLKFDTDDGVYKEDNTWLISLPCAAPDKFIARVAVDVSRGMVIIYEAWNKSNDTLKAMKLRDMVMSVWKFVANQDVTTLKWIKYQCVVEDYGFTAMQEIYDKNLAGGQEDLYIPATGRVRKLRGAFCTLILNSPFAIGAKKMLREYATEQGRSVDAFIISSSNSGFRDFTIHLRPLPRSTHQIEDASIGLDDGSVGQEEVHETGGGETLVNYLQGLRRRLFSRLPDKERAVHSPDAGAGCGSLDDDWVVVNPDDWLYGEALDEVWVWLYSDDRLDGDTPKGQG